MYFLAAGSRTAAALRGIVGLIPACRGFLSPWVGDLCLFHLHEKARWDQSQAVIRSPHSRPALPASLFWLKRRTRVKTLNSVSHRLDGMYPNIVSRDVSWPALLRTSQGDL
jgi:hypothetical protein